MFIAVQIIRLLLLSGAGYSSVADQANRFDAQTPTDDVLSVVRVTHGAAVPGSYKCSGSPIGNGAGSVTNALIIQPAIDEQLGKSK